MGDGRTTTIQLLRLYLSPSSTTCRFILVYMTDFTWMWLCAWSSFYHNTELRLVVLITDYLFKCVAIQYSLSVSQQHGYHVGTC